MIMKKVFLGFALFGFLIFGASLIVPKGDEPYCVEIKCEKTTFTEVIYADYSGRASRIAQEKHPNCKIGFVRKGQCK